jgi:C-1 hydroxylase
MSTEDNKALIQRIWEVWNQGNLDALDKFIFDAANYIEDGQAVDFENWKRERASFRAAFPDWHETINDMIAEGDKVVVRLTGHGTHKGELFGSIPPTGKQVTITGIMSFRIADGKIVEDWENWDMLGILQQVGVVPSMG